MYRLSLIISEIYNKYLPLAEKDGIILNLDFSDTTKEIADPDRVKQFLDEHLGSALKRSDKDGGEVTIGVTKEAITITDSATTLSRAACALLSNRYIDVASRVGFGTTVKIFFKPQEPATPAISPAEPKELKVENVAAGIAVDNNTKSTVVESRVKVAAKSGSKDMHLGASLKLTGQDKATQKPARPTTEKATKASKKTSFKLKPTAKLKAAKTKRQLASAAKKADREVKRIAKKAAKEAKKMDKAAKKAGKAVKKATKSAKTASKATLKQSKATAKKTTKKKLELS